ncbi:MAG: hypothetical protein V2A56_00545 [bacterium]
MKVTTWETRRDGDTVTIIAGSHVDVDLQGGLEEVLWREIADGAMHLRICLRGMRFLHATLTSALLSVERHLRSLHGDVTLVDVPWFVRSMLRFWSVENRFRFGNSRVEGPEYYSTAGEARIAIETVRERFKQDVDQVQRLLG